ncbi:MAG: group 1 glycosyl transferase, partial [Verrucomicrobiota bacterium]|nr:group 1 glycosyl transferase [Verrucomicrobiota bacterium]
MKLALVIPWFGRELKGGAEQQAWQVAARLAARGHAVEVLTTCCRSHQDDWSSNHWPAGLTSEPEGFAVRRFPVVSRDERAFAAVARTLQTLPPDALQPGLAPVSAEESRIFVEELIKSPELLDFLRAHRTDYDWFLLLPYLYGPVIDGISIVGNRAALQPCLHDEAYAYLPEVAAAFRRAALLLFNSEGEQELALRLFGPGIWPRCRLIGGGVESEPAPEITQEIEQAARERFVLYLGRKDAGKNVPLLLRAFERFRRVR